MNILVINGSPKGEQSITLQTCLFLEKHSTHTFRFLHAGKNIRALEKDFSKAEKAIREADALLFSYPVYTFLAPAQLHRFIRLMKEHGICGAGKYATQITTSKHFYDITAHRYIQDNCQEMGFRFIRGLSADMDDLLKEKGQKEALAFGKYAEWCTENGVFEPIPSALPLPELHTAHPAPDVPRKPGMVAVVADLAEDDTVLKSMIDRFRAKLPYETRLINIHEFPFRGGCVSCFHCAGSGECIYKDGFSELLRKQIQTCSAIVPAFTVQDHSMGPLFKTYDDRQFCNGHRTVTMGMPFGYLVNGALSREENLRTVMEARAQVGGNFLAGIACSERDADAETDALCAKLDYAISNRYVQPADFYGVGGMKIFRDLIWQMQGLMKADHRFYKEHGQYDFPQKHFGTMLKMYLVGALFTNEKLKAKAGEKIGEGMIAPYKKVLKEK